MLVCASFFIEVVTEAGFTAAMIAVGGFLAAAAPALEGKDDGAVRSATVVGGLLGIAFVALVSLVALLG